MKSGYKIWLFPLLLLPLSVSAQSLEQRLARMERVVESQSLLQMMERLDALQLEVQELRGQLEEQQHQMESAKERQRELYLDLDRRLSRLEREGGGMAAAPQSGMEGRAATPPLTTGNRAEPVSTPAVDEDRQEQAEVDQKPLADERAAYQKAFELLRELRYEQATAAFRDFLKKYPNGRYAHIAQYWLGEAAYARRNFSQAIKDYQALLDNHPRSGKRADAMLKIGYSYQELKRIDDAKTMMERLIELYPDSTEAGQARNQLRRLKKSGG
ncbi:MAG: tol-pal system protein YbgF [Chromatiales bacterium]|nr:tol-pal system protein YbgF [Chromatiales bacterium]